MGGIAQDFNNLLAVILSYAAFVMAELAAPSGPDSPERLEAVRRDLKQITLAAEQAASLTCQPLAFVHPEVVHPRVLDLDHVSLPPHFLLSSPPPPLPPSPPLVPWASSSPSSTTLSAGLSTHGTGWAGRMAWVEWPGRIAVKIGPFDPVPCLSITYSN